MDSQYSTITSVNILEKLEIFKPELIRLESTKFLISGSIFDFKSRKIMISIVNAFIESNGNVKKEDLCSCVYKEYQSCQSKKVKYYLKSNTVKSISRLRVELKNILPANVYKGGNWLVYCNESDSYTFYEPKPKCLIAVVKDVIYDLEKCTFKQYA